MTEPEWLPLGGSQQPHGLWLPVGGLLATTDQWLPLAPAPPALLSIPLHSLWLYRTGLGSSSAYAAVGYDDSTWDEGYDPWWWGGYAGDSVTPGTPLSPGLDVWIRKVVHTAGGDLVFSGRVDNDTSIYVDGALRFTQHYGGGGVGSYYSARLVGLAAGEHTLALYGHGDSLSGDILEVQVYEQLPRGLITAEGFDEGDTSDSLGYDWIALSGIWRRLGGAAVLHVATEAGGSGHHHVVADSGLADGTASVVLRDVRNAARGMGMVVRATDDNNLLLAAVDADGSSIYRRQGGAFVEVASSAGSSVVSGDVLSVALAGASITVKLNGVTKVSGSSSFNQTATLHGFHAYNDAVRDYVVLDGSAWDDYSFTP